MISLAPTCQSCSFLKDWRENIAKEVDMEYPDGEKRRRDIPAVALSAADYEEMSAIKGMAFECVDWVKHNKNRLETTLPLIEEALRLKIFDNWLPVRSVINNLTDKNVVNDITEAVPPESTFFDKPARVLDIVVVLNYWKGRGFLRDQDQFVYAFNVLSDALEEDIRFLATKQD